ncbi:MAG: carboxypeptidase-like regulatory domain-containing protein, partial [Acidobacteriota bacterium]|nr:carboxypeptidase-like regulatory domain-containing protein [Acidobacteriota bacterium]
MGWKLTAALGAFALSTLAQDNPASAPRIHGHVVDETNAPLSGAEVTVHIDGRPRRAFADPTGAFTLEVPRAGEYSLRVALPGYFDLRGRTVQIERGSNDISLVLN